VLADDNSDDEYRSRSLRLGEAHVLYEHRLFVPPDWRMPSGWKISTSGYLISSSTSGGVTLSLRRRHRPTPAGQ
jgi:hypothetical protein